MAFAAGAVITTAGKAIEAKRMTGNTQVVPNQMAFGTGATAAARTASVSDTALSAQSGSRVTATVTNTTTTNANDTATYVGVYTATGPVSIDEIGLFDAPTAGNMFGSITLNPLVLANTDTITYTINVQYA